jgi:hypothetical protein
MAELVIGPLTTVIGIRFIEGILLANDSHLQQRDLTRLNGKIV